jgi:hypothetical protein
MTDPKDHWMNGAVKHPGALRRELDVPADKPIPSAALTHAAQSKGKLGQRARLAEIFARSRK